MTIGPIVPINVSGVASVSGGKSIEATVPTSATGDSTDRDADGRQVLDTFDHDDSSKDDHQDAPEKKPSKVDASQNKPIVDDEGHIDFIA